MLRCEPKRRASEEEQQVAARSSRAGDEPGSCALGPLLRRPPGLTGEPVADESAPFLRAHSSAPADFRREKKRDSSRIELDALPSLRRGSASSLARPAWPAGRSAPGAERPSSRRPPLVSALCLPFGRSLFRPVGLSVFRSFGRSPVATSICIRDDCRARRLGSVSLRTGCGVRARARSWQETCAKCEGSNGGSRRNEEN